MLEWIEGYRSIEGSGKNIGHERGGQEKNLGCDGDHRANHQHSPVINSK